MGHQMPKGDGACPVLAAEAVELSGLGSGQEFPERGVQIDPSFPDHLKENGGDIELGCRRRKVGGVDPQIAPGGFKGLAVPRAVRNQGAARMIGPLRQKTGQAGRRRGAGRRWKEEAGGGQEMPTVGGHEVSLSAVKARISRLKESDDRQVRQSASRECRRRH